MRRILTIVLVTFAARAAAQGEDGSAVPVTRLTVNAAPAPVPALRYRLLPELRDLTPGNAVVLYYRAFSPEWITTVRTNRTLIEAMNAALDPAQGKTPADVRSDPALAFVRTMPALKEVDRAARRAYVDWELAPRIREDGVGLLLPDVQAMREFANLLAIRTRLELADRDFDAAIHSMQTGLAMGRHVADAPTLIQSLVGVALDAVTFNQIEELIRTPGSPNLYWALVNLPRPFVDMHRPYEGERIFLDQIAPGYREALRKKAMDPQSPEAFAKFRRDFAALGSGDDAAVALLAVRKYVPAKKLLTASGWNPAAVEALPALQVVLLAEVAQYDRWFDEMAKWIGFPYPLVRKELKAAEQRLNEDLGATGGRGASLAGLLLPATMSVQFAATRTDRRIAALVAVEALRLHAAATGALPDKLADVAVPLLSDPVTGASIEYGRSGDRATLTLPPPKGEPTHFNNSMRYEITVVK